MSARSVRILAVLLLCLSAVPAFADDLTPELEGLVAEATRMVSNWEWWARLQFALILVVAVLGGASAVIQVVESKRTKVATMIIGAAVGVLTVVNSEGFSRSHKAVWRDADAAHSMIKKCGWIISRYKRETDPANQRELVDDFHKLITQINDLPAAGAVATASLGTGSLGLIEIALYAQAARPAWVTKPPTDRQFLYFVGTGRSASISEAKALSHEEAVKKALASLAATPNKRGPEDNAALHAYIDRSATAADTYLEYVGASGYVHYTLLRLSLALADARTIQTLLDRADPWLLLPPKRRALGEARFSVPGKAVSSTAAIIVRSAAPADGHFELIFSTRLGPRGVVLRLNEIRVTEDGSSGNAAWQFEVQANGQPAFTVRSRDYNDGRVPVVFGVSEPVEATVAIGAGQTILVTVRASRT